MKKLVRSRRRARQPVKAKNAAELAEFFSNRRPKLEPLDLSKKPQHMARPRFQLPDLK